MDSPVAPRGSFENEGQKLKACEENLRRYHQLALAGRLVGATMHEVNNRLAALTNLIFLARTLSDRSLQSVEYLEEADSQFAQPWGDHHQKSRLHSPGYRSQRD
jgi:C4-dicarboxylate-specific signal transduction histidine kinase